MKRWLLAAALVAAMLPATAQADNTAVTTQAEQLVCTYDPGGVCSAMRSGTVVFEDMGQSGDLGYVHMIPLGVLQSIRLDQSLLREPQPVIAVATVLIHESRHKWDMSTHPLLQIDQDHSFCYWTESNAITEMTKFWLWLHPSGLPGGTMFERGMASQAAQLAQHDPIQVESWPAYQQECGPGSAAAVTQTVANEKATASYLGAAAKDDGSYLAGQARRDAQSVGSALNRECSQGTSRFWRGLACALT